MIRESHSSASDASFGVQVPVYSRAFLDELIGSLIGQTYPYWKLFLAPVHAGDADFVAATAAGYGDPRITVLPLPPQAAGGYGRVMRSLAAAGAETEYVLPLDDCDRLLPQTLASFREGFRQMPWAALLRASRRFVTV